ncbi:phosphoribosyltransferase, partial [Candidatus Peribacteria bacterium]|nr:phosphoribosyltransferase [Candidatus Peribacteria bacterium]MBT4474663.1 phosphoribosyltransferase [Candidatus Peribacteria bacterium]
MTDIKDLFKKANAIIENDHIVYTSGKHGSVYLNKDALYPHTELASEVGKMFAEKYKDKDIDIVVAPALGGIILSQWTAHHLSKIKNKEILGAYAEKDLEGTLVLKRGYDKLVAGKNILVVEDITNTGGSIKKTIQVTEKADGNVVAACVMINRSPETVTSETMGAPFDALGVIEAEAFE